VGDIYLETPYPCHRIFACCSMSACTRIISPLPLGSLVLHSRPSAFFRLCLLFLTLIYSPLFPFFFFLCFYLFYSVCVYYLLSPWLFVLLGCISVSSHLIVQYIISLIFCICHHANPPVFPPVPLFRPCPCPRHPFFFLSSLRPLLCVTL